MKNLPSKRGIAIILALTVITVLSLVVVELSFTTRINSEIALNQQDELKALYLAKSGLEYTKILIRMDIQLSNQMDSLTGKACSEELQVQGLCSGVASMHLWDFLPINYPPALSSLLGTMGGSEGEQTPAEQELGGETKETSQEEKKDQAEVDEDEYYTVDIVSESCKINLNALAEEKKGDLASTSGLYKLLFNLLNLEEYLELFKDNYNLKEDLIYSIKDWVDKDNTGSNPRMSADENTPYATRTDRYKVKNAPFDTFEEIFLVDGMTYPLYAQIFEKFTTVYGDKDDKINIACELDTIAPIVKAVISQTVQMNRDDILKEIKDRGGFGDLKQLKTVLEQITGVKDPIDKDIEKLLTNKDTKFRVVSTGMVREAMKKITTVIQRGKSSADPLKTLYWRID